MTYLDATGPTSVVRRRFRVDLQWLEVHICMVLLLSFRPTASILSAQRLRGWNFSGLQNLA